MTDDELKAALEKEALTRPRWLQTEPVAIGKTYPFRPKPGITVYAETDTAWVLDVTHGKCPCDVCGHEWMVECEAADCQCCCSTCT